MKPSAMKNELNAVLHFVCFLKRTRRGATQHRHLHTATIQWRDWTAESGRITARGHQTVQGSEDRFIWWAVGTETDEVL